MHAHSDPFSVLGLPQTMQLSRSLIDAAYFARVSDLHPDASVERIEGGEESEAAMAVLNHARATLADAEKRAEALLIAQNPRMARTDVPLEPLFLMEIMEVREAVDDAVDSGDAAAIERWRGWVDSQRGEMVQATSKAFEDANHQRVRSLLNAWRYIERLSERLRDVGGGRCP